METQNIPWDAITAQLKDEANEEQLLEIKEWLDLSSENPVILSEIVNTWSITKQESQFYKPDMTINWEKLMQRIGHSQGRKVRFRSFYKWAAAASILVLVFLAGLKSGDIYLKKASTISFIRIIAPEGSKTQIVLPDSTRVWLNSGTVLQYPNNFSVQNRQVYMNGECFFDVTKDPKHPFVVEGSKFRVKVFGTRFNVNERTCTNEADVTLISGKVDVYSLNNKFLSKLDPGQQLVYSDGLSRVQKAQNPEALTSWINNMLIFDNQPFERVIFYLEKWYGVKIHLDRFLYHKYNYTFKVKTESLREVLQLISFITPIEYKIEGDQVFIKNKQSMRK